MNELLKVTLVTKYTEKKRVILKFNLPFGLSDSIMLYGDPNEPEMIEMYKDGHERRIPLRLDLTPSGYRVNEKLSKNAGQLKRK